MCSAERMIEQRRPQRSFWPYVVRLLCKPCSPALSLSVPPSHPLFLCVRFWADVCRPWSALLLAVCEFAFVASLHGHRRTQKQRLDCCHLNNAARVRWPVLVGVVLCSSSARVAFDYCIGRRHSVSDLPCVINLFSLASVALILSIVRERVNE